MSTSTPDHSAVSDAEIKIRELVKERNLLTQNLNRRGGRGGRAGPSTSNSNRTPIGTRADPYGRGSTEIRHSSNQEKSFDRDNWTNRSNGVDVPPKRSLLTPEDVTIEERPKSRGMIDKDTMNRGSRLFGGLMGHLKKAKSAEEAAADDEALQKKKSAEEIVEKRLKNFGDNLREARRLEAIARKNEDLSRMREVRIDIQVEERKLLRLKLEQHYVPMMNFLRTDADPSLFFKPAKLTPSMMEQIEDTKLKIQSKIETLRGEFDEEALRKELLTKQLEWEAEHPLREPEIRDKAAMLAARERAQSEREERVTAEEGDASVVSGTPEDIMSRDASNGRGHERDAPMEEETMDR